MVGVITYWHTELANHDTILADGLEVVSYLDMATSWRSAQVICLEHSSIRLHPIIGAPDEHN